VRATKGFLRDGVRGRTYVLVACLSESSGRDGDGGGEWKRSKECWVVKAGNCRDERRRVVWEVVMGFWIRGFKTLEGIRSWKCPVDYIYIIKEK
jgi:hypothetical protein